MLLWSASGQRSRFFINITGCLSHEKSSWSTYSLNLINSPSSYGERSKNENDSFVCLKISNSFFYSRLLSTSLVECVDVSVYSFPCNSERLDSSQTRRSIYISDWWKKHSIQKRLFFLNCRWCNRASIPSTILHNIGLVTLHLFCLAVLSPKSNLIWIFLIILFVQVDESQLKN